jgi:hypothetical protein
MLQAQVTRYAGTLAALLILTGCPETPIGVCPENFFGTPFSVSFVPNLITKKGLKVDSAFPVDLDALDARVEKISACIWAISRSKPQITEEERIAWGCLSTTMREDVPLSCISIRVVNPVPSCSTWQLLPAPAPNELCRAKGLEPTPECPCMWRSLIQDDYTILTPPALYLWDVGRALTGCNNIWFSGYTECLMY